MEKVRKTMMVVLSAAILFIPVVGIAGSLEPSGAPAPTMKTLDQIPPTWSQKLQCDATACPRFELVLDGAAVLDKETGLVWEKSPAKTTYLVDQAPYHCISQNLGGRMGWHLPTIEQLASLVDLSVAGSPKLPAGHPFDIVFSTGGAPPSCYWSATTVIGEWQTVNFSNGHVGDCVGFTYAWCVRGGETRDDY